MQEKSLGFDREHIVTMSYNNELNNKFESFRTDLLNDSHIKNVTASSRIPTGRLLDAMGTQIERNNASVPITGDIKYVAIDDRFVSTYGVHIVAGRDFSKDFSTDTTSFLINEAAVQALGFKNSNDVLGKNIKYGFRHGQIVGVINDFHFESMHQKIVPLILLVPKSPFEYGRISIKIAAGNIPAAISALEKTWTRFLPDAPFEYTFMDENFDKLYKSEQRQGNIFTVFASIAIFIACLGLLGLSAFTISQRIKEIGIRKVLGASTGSIVGLLSKDFMKLVVIAAIIAIPISWYAMNNWLQDFAYRTTLQWWIFVTALAIAGFIALATISVQAIKAALANPVKSLRSE